MLVKSLILPLITYCDSIYATNINAMTLRILERALNACTRFVFALKRSENIDEYRNRILGCSLVDFYKYRRTAFIQKLLINKELAYLFNQLHISTRSNLLILPRHITSQYNKSFFVNAVANYNMLPNVLKMSATLHNFKKRYFERFFT